MRGKSSINNAERSKYEEEKERRMRQEGSQQKSSDLSSTFV
jgi:hypothetical protein